MTKICIEAADFFINNEIYDVAFTFEIYGSKYAAFYDPDDIRFRNIICRHVKWNPWSGLYLGSFLLKKNVRDAANMIISKHSIDPEKYPLKGEHYVISDVIDREGIKKHRIMRQKKPAIFGTTAKMTVEMVGMVVTMLLAVAVLFYYSSSGGIAMMSWVFPSLSRNAALYAVAVVEIVGAMYIYFINRNQKNGLVDAFLYAVIPLGIIDMLGMLKMGETAKRIFIIILFIVSYCLFSLSELFDKTKRGNWLTNLLNVLRGFRIPLAVCAVACIIIVNVYGFSGYILKGTVDENATREVISEKYEEACIKLKKETWETLDNQSKVDILQSICDYECTEILGCETISIKVGYTDEGVLGSYNDVADNVIINIDHLEDAPVEKVLDTMLHEIRHMWQHTIVDMYNKIEPKLDNKYKNLQIFRMAKDFRENIDDYHDGESTDNYDEYYYQVIESDSRDWAKYEILNNYTNYIYPDAMDIVFEQLNDSD